jgi:hypothetical protein
MHVFDRRPAIDAGCISRLAIPGLFLALAVGGCSGAASTQGRFVAVHNAFDALGLNQVGHISEGSLGEGGTARFPMELEGQCYTFVAFGGDGARDIDVTILDANNQRVAGDSSHDAQASVQFCPPTRSRYTISLRMTAGGGSYVLGSWRGGLRGGGIGGTAVANAGEGGAGTCSQPIPIQIGQTLSGDTTHAGSNQVGSCLGEGNAPELVYQLQVERRMLVTVAAEQDYDGALYIRSNCEDAQSEPGGACNDDDNDTSHSRVSAALDPGTYYIFADGFSDNHGSFTLTVTGGDVPSPAEVCQQASALTPGQAMSGQTSASSDPNVFQASCANHAPGPDHVYRLDVPQESRLQLFQESDYDGALYVRRACADQNSEIGCNDDAEDVQHSRINTIVPPGTYYVFTDAYSAQGSGSFTLEADLAPVAGGSGMSGDSCTDAQPLTNGQTVDGNTFLAHDDVTTPCGIAQDGYDTIYRLEITGRSHVRLFFEGNDNRQGVIYLTRACGTGGAAANANIACRAGAIGEDNAVDAVLDRGTYYVVVDSAQARAFGRYRLATRIEDIAALERVCRAATPLRSGQTVTGTISGDDRFQSTCAGGSHNPENLYRLNIRRRSFVRLALTATSPNYDPSIYLRANCSDPSTERACNDDVPGDTRHSLIETTLEPGTYTVFVDGFGQHSTGSYSLETTINPQ